MNPDAFYRVAESLMEVGCEASCRSAASRAYYSVFHVARDDTAGVMLDNPPPGSHQKVQDRVGKRYGHRMKRTLRSMSRKRNEADYDLDEDYSPQDAIQLIELRRIFLEELERKQNP